MTIPDELAPLARELALGHYADTLIQFRNLCRTYGHGHLVTREAQARMTEASQLCDALHLHQQVAA